jgi:hypothetical protein
VNGPGYHCRLLQQCRLGAAGASPAGAFVARGRTRIGTVTPVRNPILSPSRVGCLACKAAHCLPISWQAGCTSRVFCDKGGSTEERKEDPASKPAPGKRCAAQEKGRGRRSCEKTCRSRRAGARKGARLGAHPLLFVSARVRTRVKLRRARGDTRPVVGAAASLYCYTRETGVLTLLVIHQSFAPAASSIGGGPVWAGGKKTGRPAPKRAARRSHFRRRLHRRPASSPFRNPS